MENKIHWIDLDGTLIKTNAKVWIIDKKNPKNHIIKIDSYQAQLITTGYHKNDNLLINYNGINGWLSIELYTKIKSLKNIDINDIGISYREFTTNELIEKQAEDFISYIDKFKHLDGTINILTARANKEAHSKIIDKLKQDLNIDNQYFITDPSSVKFIGSIEEKKMYCIIESIIGHKIDNNKFIPLIVNSCDNIYMYDDLQINIDICKNITFYIKSLLSNTEDWLKERIEKSIKLRKIKLNLYLVTTNEENPFEITELDINL